MVVQDKALKLYPEGEALGGFSPLSEKKIENLTLVNAISSILVTYFDVVKIYFVVCAVLHYIIVFCLFIYFND